MPETQHICSAAAYCPAGYCRHKEGHDLDDTCPKRCGRFPRAECFPVGYESGEAAI